MMAIPAASKAGASEQVRLQIEALMKNSGEFPSFIVDLVAFDIPFEEVVKIANSHGFNMTPAKLVKIVEENLETVVSRRAEFMDARLRYIVEKSLSVIPEMHSLYERAHETYIHLEGQERYRDAANYLANLSKILDMLATIELELKQTEKAVNVNVFAHGDLNVKVIQSLQDRGALQITDQDTLRRALGFSDKAASFIERFREG